MKEYSFEKLEVWQNSRVLVKEIFLLTKHFPDYEKYGLISQMRRAVVSISSNIAEESGRTSNKDFAHFIQIAYGSLMELLNQIILSLDLEFIDDVYIFSLRERIDEITNKLTH